jgi:hypothetical protein
MFAKCNIFFCVVMILCVLEIPDDTLHTLHSAVIPDDTLHESHSAVIPDDTLRELHSAEMFANRLHWYPENSHPLNKVDAESDCFVNIIKWFEDNLKTSPQPLA